MTDPSVLKSTGNCKPEDEPATLKTVAPGHPDMKSQYREGRHSERVWKTQRGPISNKNHGHCHSTKKKRKLTKIKSVWLALIMSKLRDVAGVITIVEGTKPSTDLMTQQLASHASPSHTSSHILAQHSPLNTGTMPLDVFSKKAPITN